MCEIQLMHCFDNKNLTITDKSFFNELMCLGGQYNKSAWGVYDITNAKLIKEGGQYVDGKLKDFLEDNKTTTLLGHNRLATHGVASNSINNHPLESEHFIVLHNGVLSNHDDIKKTLSLTYASEVDSYVIIALLEHLYALTNKDVSRTISLVASILYGSFSVVTYFKEEQRLFYFKESRTDFQFALFKNDEKNEVLLGCTDNRNFEYVYSSLKRGLFKVNNSMRLYKPNSECIYEITNSELVIFQYFKETSYTVAHSPLLVLDEDKWICSKPVELIPSNNKNHNRGLSQLVDNTPKRDMDYIDEDSVVGDYVINDVAVINDFAELVSNYLTENLGLTPLSDKYSYSTGEFRLLLESELSTDELLALQQSFDNMLQITQGKRVNSKVPLLNIKVLCYYFPVE